jgi:hypothetical protein
MFQRFSVLGISVADPGCFIPDPRSGSLIFSSRIPDARGKKALGSYCTEKEG